VSWEVESAKKAPSDPAWSGRDRLCRSRAHQVAPVVQAHGRAVAIGPEEPLTTRIEIPTLYTRSMPCRSDRRAHGAAWGGDERYPGPDAFSLVHSARPTRDSSHGHVMWASCDERRPHPDMPGRHVIMI
jgi:hypothetical protein